MFQPERIEERIILACARPEGYKTKFSTSFNDSEVNWTYVLDLASRHKISPLLYYFLNHNKQIQVPDEVASLLKRHVSEQAVTNLFQTQELIRVLDLLKIPPWR